MWMGPGSAIPGASRSSPPSADFQPDSPARVNTFHQPGDDEHEHDE